MFKKIFYYFSSPKKLAILNFILIAIILLLNTYIQAFCIPTTWAIILLVICFTNTILYPILFNTKLYPLTSFINGISLFVFLYCVIFLEHINLYGLLLIITGIGLIVFIPHFFFIQLIWKNLIKPPKKSIRYFFLAANILCIVIIVFISQEYKEAIHSIEKFKKSNYTKLDKTFMTEKILGMHFIYHTQFCEYDGWRPPKHEPILVIGMWLNKRIDPLNVDLKKRLALYKKFFPERKYKFSCSCAIEYSHKYHNDTLWKE